MINWSRWFVQLFISTLTIAGVLISYRRLWLQVFRHHRLSKTGRMMVRVALNLLPILFVGILGLVQIVDPIKWVMYTNIQLFILTYVLLDEEINAFEFYLRVGYVVVFWLVEHNMSSMRQLIMFGVFLSVIVVIRRHPLMVHYNVWVNSLVTFTTAFSFWDAHERLYGAPEFAPVLTFVIVTLVCFVYWTTLHIQDEAERALTRRASVDALTNARNYARFQTDITHLFKRAVDEKRPMTVVMLDIDHFKIINDTYGHLAGNVVLSGVTHLLTETLSQYASADHKIYRTGGEEFNIIFFGHHPEEILPIVTACWQAVRTHTFNVDGREITATISMGITEMRESDQSVNNIYKRADDNLYQSKRAGRDTITVELQTLKTEDKRAEKTSYAFFTQPIINATDHAVMRVELLLRLYDNEKREWVLPTSFDLDMQFQLSLVKRALSGLKLGSIVLNLTRAQFANDEVAYQIVEFVAKTPGLNQLVIEVTDLPEDAVATRAVAAIYRAAEIEIAIDDVGGRNSQEKIDAVINEVDALKVSLQTVSRANDCDDMALLITHWRDYAQQHNKQLILEGIESAADEQLALSLGVTQLQGFFYSRPRLPQYS